MCCLKAWKEGNAAPASGMAVLSTGNGTDGVVDRSSMGEALVVGEEGEFL